MQKTTLSIWLLILSLLNGTFAFSAQLITGEISVSACTANCITIEIPNTISLFQPKLLKNSEDNIQIATNYPLSEKITINDIRSTGGFNLQVQSTPVINPDSSIILNYTNIGILTFNQNSVYPVDSNSPNPNITALNNQPVNYLDFQNHNLPDNLFYYFTGSNPTLSDPITSLISAPSTSSLYGSYSFGFGLNIKTPPSPHTIPNLFISTPSQSLSLTLTFTLIPT